MFLDVAGGKAGDLLKWRKARVSRWVIVDIAYNSIIDAVNRYNTASDANFPATFVCADFSQKGILGSLPLDIGDFDLVSCQFALHYSFETEERARQLLENVSARLTPGAYFIGTIPNACRIIKKLRSIDGLSFGNSYYTIEFEQRDTFSAFGAKYFFTLQDAVTRCPEFLVHFQTLRNIAQDVGLEFRYRKTFDEFYKDTLDDENAKLLRRMKALNGDTLSKEEWEVISLYVVFAFQKKGLHNLPKRSTARSNKPVNEREVIVVPKSESKGSVMRSNTNVLDANAKSLVSYDDYEQT